MLKSEFFVGLNVNNIDSEMCGKMGSQEIIFPNLSCAWQNAFRG